LKSKWFIGGVVGEPWFPTKESILSEKKRKVKNKKMRR
jgi:hypothetical protein